MAIAAVKFFLGQDEAGEGSNDEDDDAQENVAGPSKAELYAAHKKARAKLQMCIRRRGDGHVVFRGSNNEDVSPKERKLALFGCVQDRSAVCR